VRVEFRAAASFELTVGGKRQRAAEAPLPAADFPLDRSVQVTLKAKEKSMSISGDNFTVIGPDGSAWFK
jgi:hypothetical protein